MFVAGSDRIRLATKAGAGVRGGLAGGLPRRTRPAVVALVVMLAAASVSQVVGDAWAATKRERLAELLLKRDPGKRVGGDTLVGSTAGAVLRGVRDRPGGRPQVRADPGDQEWAAIMPARGSHCRSFTNAVVKVVAAAQDEEERCRQTAASTGSTSPRRP